MCELFGFTSRKPLTVNDELKSFFSHSDEHPNGWGLALLDKDRFSLEKEPIRALDSLYLKQRLRSPIVAQAALAHIRLATIGIMEWKNCHPFTGTDQSGRHWTLIHNGTIFECSAMEKYVRTQSGDTDSERILLFILDRMNKAFAAKGRRLTAEERFRVLDEVVVAAAPENKLNLLIYDGELLYAHTNFQNSLYQRVTPDSVFISTRPLTLDDWEPVPMTQLIAYRREQLAFTGTVHGQEYHFDAKKMELLFLAFAEL